MVCGGYSTVFVHDLAMPPQDSGVRSWFRMPAMQTSVIS